MSIDYKFASKLKNTYMDNETTRLINDESTQKEQPTSASQTQPMKSATKMSRKTNPMAAGAGGFVAGVAVGVGASAMAGNKEENIPNLEVSEEEKTEEAKAEENLAAEEHVETPAPEQVILANDEGIRYAQVEANNFNDAYAQARAQVGPGGVFEYNGKIYSTYTKEEWSEMSAEERNDYQARVFENASVQSSSHSSTAHNSVSHTEVATNVAEHHEPIHADVTAEMSESIPANAEMIAAEPVDNEIRVLGVEAVQNGYGEIMNVALVECEGDQALLIDVDNNGVMDVLLHDDNYDGEIQESEVHDISGAGLEVADLLQAQAAQEGDVFYASNDDMPDYINDADSIMTV